MIRLENITKYYKSNDLIAVGIRKINLEFKIGEFVAITGESGSGKSTLLNILSGLDTFEEGEFFLNNEKTSHYSISDWETYRSSHVGFVFQNYNILDSYTVFQNVLIALEFQGYDMETRNKRAIELIEKVGLSHRIHHRASKLSGGEKQRTVIARALAKDCKMIFCDEPTGNLDSQSAQDILKLLHDISKDKLVIIVTHNYDDVINYITRRIKMSDGEIVEDIDIKKVTVNKDNNLEIRNKKVGLLTSLNIALRNVLSQPKKFIFFLLLQAVFVFLVLLIYGTVSSLSYQNQILPGSISASTHQIVVQKANYETFSQDEISQFSSHRLIKVVDKNESLYSFFKAFGNRKIFTESIKVLKKSDLSSGKFPNHQNEIIISEDLKIFLNTDINNEVNLISASGDSYLYLITGISKSVNSSIYFHPDFFTDDEIYFRSFIQEASINVFDEFSFITPFLNTYSMVYEDATLPENSVKAEMYHPDKIGTRSALIYITTGYDDHYEMELDITFVFTESSKKLYVASNVYNALKNQVIENQPTYKIILNVYDQYDGIRVLNSIDKNNYIVYYDIITPNTDTSTFGTLLKLISYLAIVFVALFIFTILRFVFKSMVITRRKDFAILRSVGANKKFLSYLIILEQLIQLLTGTILTLLIVLILSTFVRSIENTVKFLSIIDVLVVFLVFTYMTIRTPLRFNKDIFEISVIDTLRSSTEV